MLPLDDKSLCCCVKKITKRWRTLFLRIYRKRWAFCNIVGKDGIYSHTFDNFTTSTSLVKYAPSSRELCCYRNANPCCSELMYCVKPTQAEPAHVYGKAAACLTLYSTSHMSILVQSISKCWGRNPSRSCGWPECFTILVLCFLGVSTLLCVSV